jgi:hypothetical protein
MAQPPNYSDISRIVASKAIDFSSFENTLKRGAGQNIGRGNIPYPPPTPTPSGTPPPPPSNTPTPTPTPSPTGAWSRLLTPFSFANGITLQGAFANQAFYYNGDSFDGFPYTTTIYLDNEYQCDVTWLDDRITNNLTNFAFAETSASPKYYSTLVADITGQTVYFNRY